MTLNPTIHSILWGNSAGLVHVTNFLPSYRWGDYVAIVFWITTVFTERCDWTNVGHLADLFKGILIDSNLPVTCWHPWSFIVVLTAPKTSNCDLIWFDLHWLGVSASHNRISLPEAYLKGPVNRGGPHAVKRLNTNPSLLRILTSNNKAVRLSLWGDIKLIVYMHAITAFTRKYLVQPFAEMTIQSSAYVRSLADKFWEVGT